MPSRFIFKLQPVLEQRERLERDHQIRVAALERQRLDLEDRLRTIQARIDLSKADLRSRLHPSPQSALVIVRDVRMQAGASIALLAQAQGVAIELAGVLRRLEAARAELFAAAAARKAVQLLKDRRYALWRSEQEKRDALATDEIAAAAFIRAAQASH